MDKTLNKIRERARTNHIPILKEESAQFLRTLITLKKPLNVLEIGTGIGYSGIIILSSCAANLITTEHNENSLREARQNFEECGYLGRVTTVFGDESEIIPLLNQKFDFIFLDGAKTRYIQHLPYLKKLLNKNGVLLADNVLHNGYVTGENPAGSKESIARALRQFLNEICSDGDFATSVLKIGDGMSLSVLTA